MSEVTEWISQAGLDLARQFSRCPRQLALQVQQQAKSAFVRGDPRVWWLGLLPPLQRFDSSACTLTEVLPGATVGWFILEDDSDELPVYDLTIEEVELIRQNCPFFEYYYVDKEYRWLVAESDHDEFIVARRIAEP